MLNDLPPASQTYLTRLYRTHPEWAKEIAREMHWYPAGVDGKGRAYLESAMLVDEGWSDDSSDKVSVQALPDAQPQRHQRGASSVPPVRVRDTGRLW